MWSLYVQGFVVLHNVWTGTVFSVICSEQDSRLRPGLGLCAQKQFCVYTYCLDLVSEFHFTHAPPSGTWCCCHWMIQGLYTVFPLPLAQVLALWSKSPILCHIVKPSCVLSNNTSHDMWLFFFNSGFCFATRSAMKLWLVKHPENSCWMHSVSLVNYGKTLLPLCCCGSFTDSGSSHDHMYESHRGFLHYACSGELIVLFFCFSKTHIYPKTVQRVCGRYSTEHLHLYYQTVKVFLGILRQVPKRALRVYYVCV